MKNLMIIAAMIIMASAVSAQEFTAKVSRTGGFNPDAPSIVQTSESITIDGEVFTLHKTEKGTKFIKCMSPRTGNNYPVWIGNETKYQHEGRKVYQMKSGTYCVYKISAKTGNPYATYLDAK